CEFVKMSVLPSTITPNALQFSNSFQITSSINSNIGFNNSCPDLLFSYVKRK
ncbi:13075_t:CDS:1, partial [Entrophospora sp. SA101]